MATLIFNIVHLFTFSTDNLAGMVESYEIRAVKNFLHNKFIEISEQNEWLQGCCSWYKSNNSDAAIQDLQNFVYDQWLLADLRDIGESPLMRNLASLEKTCIRENCALQVDCILNIGESCYSQLERIRKICTKNIDVTETNKPNPWEPKPRRMLKLTCTDGVQILYGMEYTAIPSLNEPFIPGFKILIKGPIECRRGVMLLGPQNILVLGGESDTLLVKNALENVLARALNLEENSNPYQGTQSTSAPAAVGTQSSTRSNIENSNPYQTAQPSSIDRDAQSITRAETMSPTNMDDFPDDDLFLCDQLTQVENLYRQENINTASTSGYGRTETNRIDEFSNTFPSSSGSFINNNPIAPMKKDRPPIGIARPIISPSNFPNKRPAPSPTQTDLKIAKTTSSSASSTVQNAVQSKPSTFRTFNETADIMDSFSPDTFETCISISRLKEMSGQPNFVSVCDCNASFRQLTSKPRIREDSWQLTAEIIDETGTLEVMFSDTYLETVFEFSAIEVAAQKERVKVNPIVKERIDKILKRGVQKIMSLKGRFRIQFSPNTRLGEVIDVAQ